MAPLLFILTVLIWGTTWYAIKLQVGIVPAEVSILYRFALAAILLLGLLALRRRLAPPPFQHWLTVGAQGLCLFCCNFLCFYYAAGMLPSGIVSVVFAMATLFNAANAWLLHGNRPSGRVILAGAVGLFGLMLLFADELRALGTAPQGGFGLLLALTGTYCFSLGNFLSARHQTLGLDLPSTTAYAMVCGVAALGVLVLARGLPLTFDPSPAYTAALLYLAIPGSVIGFLAYLALVGQWGPARASYATVLFPLVALTVSTVFEGYDWTAEAVLGLIFALGGNVIMFGKPIRLQRTAQVRQS
ncbi:DMT family transporter [Rhizobium sullae]|uniref:EamA-like transporter family protein n=1 Tax=Rhizobium sullae TaxID=50338 RepID=A0A4R3PXU7_RHISU|nr:EamA family transporter [Rhizobium sullae]TCU13470.1 EamA-like transporter family protein [Rhizobium sullae]